MIGLQYGEKTMTIW